MHHTKKQNEHKPRVWAWFMSLSCEERGNVLMWEDKYGAELLKQMYKKKWSEGDGFFLEVDDPAIRKLAEGPIRKGPHASMLPPLLEENFCFTKLSVLDNYFCYPDSVVEVDRQLEESVRLCDTREYCDTLTVASYILEDGEKFLSIMEIVTRGGFLTSPCRVKWEDKQWVWETPTWFKGMGYYSLGTYVAHKLEQAIWRRYWQSHNADPRKIPGSSLNKGKREQLYNFSPNIQGLHSKTHLMNFWDGLTNEERTRIVGRIGEIVEEVLIGDRKENKILDWQKPLSTLLDLLLTLLDEQLLNGFHSDPISLNKIRNHDEHEKNFIEFVYFSPMHRAFEPLDLIVRRMGKCIQSGYTEKIAMDLILGEEKDKKSKKKKGKKKKGQTPKKNEKKEREQSRKAKKKGDELERSYSDIIGSSNTVGNNKRSKSRSCIRENAIPAAEDTRLSKSQPGSPRQHHAQPPHRRRNSSPLTPEHCGANTTPPTSNNNMRHSGETKTVNSLRQSGEHKNANNNSNNALRHSGEHKSSPVPAKPAKDNSRSRRSNGIMLSEGLRSGQSQDDCNLRSGGQVATSSKQRRRRRKRRKELNSSAGAQGAGGLSTSTEREVLQFEVSEFSPSGNKATATGRGRGALGGSVSSDGWGGSVSDSALEDEEIEEENLQKMNQLKAYGPLPKKANPSPIKEEQPQQSKPVATPKWEEEEEEEEEGSGGGEDDTEREKEAEAIVASNQEVGVSEMALQDEAERKEDDENESPMRGRTRLRSCSSSAMETSETSHMPAPTVRRTRARSQPPSKEAPEQTTHSALLAAKADSLPELQLAEFHNTRYQYSRSKDTSSISDDQAFRNKPASYRNVQLNGSTYGRTRFSRYSYRPNLVQIVQEEREKEWERERAERTGMAGPRAVLSARTSSAPVLNNTPLSPHHTRPSSSILKGAPQGTTMRAIGPGHPTSSYVQPFPTGDVNQPQYSRVSHLLTQSLSDVERVLFLHREIEDYVKYTISITSVRRVHQEAMLQKMTEIVKQIWGTNARVECYGSFATGLCIPSSDLDIVVIISAPFPPQNIDSPGMGDAILRRDWSPIRILAEELKKQDWLSSIQTIETAKVPVIKLVSQVDGNNILIDITFSIESPKASTDSSPSLTGRQWDGDREWSVARDEHSGIAAAKLVRRYTRSIPALTPLALVLKQFLHERGLNNTYTGGISSYCLVLMIVAFLQLNVPQSRPRRTYRSGKGTNGSASSGGTSSDLPEEENLGATLLAFLRFFGMQFDFDKMGISLHNGGTYFYLNEPCHTLVIMDPFQPDRNIGHSVFGMWRVKAAFKYAFSTLISPYTTNFAPTILSRMLQGYDASNSSNSPPPVLHDQENDVYLPPWVPRHAAYTNLEFGSGDGRTNSKGDFFHH